MVIVSTTQRVPTNARQTSAVAAPKVMTTISPIINYRDNYLLENIECTILTISHSGEVLTTHISWMWVP